MRLYSLGGIMPQSASTTDSAGVVAETVSLDQSLSTIIDTLAEMWTTFVANLPRLMGGVAVVLATWAIAAILDRVIRATLSRTRMRGSLKDLLAQLTYIGIWVGGLMVASVVAFEGMTPTKVITVLGLGSIAIGFAFKDIVENFFAGVLILWRFPFDPGDYIECDGISGKVESITIRMTMIRQTDGQLVVLPNAMLFKAPVNVLTDQRTRRVTVVCGVAYDTDVDEARDVIRKAVESCESVNRDKPVEIFAQEFADSSVNFEVTWWTSPTPLDIRKSRDEIVAKVKRSLDDAGIEIPFPYRTRTFKEPLRTQADVAETTTAS